MHKSIEAYINLFENLSPEVIREMDSFVAEDVYFKDPFNEINQISDLRKILTKTLEDVEAPNFKVEEVFETSGNYMLKWHFQGRIPVLGLWKVTGISEIRLNADGLVNYHVDYWDASEHFYLRLPLIGAAIKLIRRRLQV